MDISNLINEEKFFIGIPIEISDTCTIYFPTLREIANIGAKNFYSYLNLLTLDKEDVDEFFSQQGLENNEISPFQFTLMNAHNDSMYLNNLKRAFDFFLHEKEIYILVENEAIVLGDLKENRIINSEKFDAICSVLRASHNVGQRTNEQKMDNPSNAKAAEIIKKIKEGRKLKEKTKNSELSFLDLVASLAAKGNGINPFNVWDLTYYAFNDQFKRMQAIEDYEQAIRSIQAGADPKKIKVEHWIKSIQDKK